MPSFIDSLQVSTNQNAFTENGARTNTSTLDPLLDFFSRAGAMRDREADAVNLFAKAYAVDKTSALKALFYLRDIRGGQGERKIFLAIISWLTDNDLPTLEKVNAFIPEYGRWDEVVVTDNTLSLIRDQFAQDEASMAKGESVSLFAKWMPSENASSKKTRSDAVKLARALGLKPSQYRRKIVALRKYIKLLEQKMSAKEWGAIEYDKIPAQAHRKHVKAFKRNDEARYTEFLGAVEKGEKTINAGTLFTYEIYEMMHDYSQNGKTADALWAALPDYTNGHNALVLADVSGSMTGRPMATSVSLALYYAEHNKGPFKDYFMTFTAQPQLQKIVGDTLTDRMNSIQNADWGMNTNLESALRSILNAAIKSNATQDELPQILYVISDMEFDAATSDNTNFEHINNMFVGSGYTLPHVVFWNVDARTDQSPATKFDGRVTLISGSSQSTFQYVVAGKTPLESMYDILNSERYAQIEA